MRALPAAPTPVRSLGDAGAATLAALVVVGAELAWPVPLSLGLGATMLALAARRPWLLIGGAFLLASTFAARADAGMHPVRSGRAQGEVTLVSDPAPTFGGVRALVRWHGKRLEARAFGSAVGALAVSLAGERVVVDASVRPARAPDDWLRVHHVVGIMDVAEAERSGAGSAPWRAANQVRRLVERGAATLPPKARSLFTGFVLGDDRDESPVVLDDFRASGLSHLLAVSGENVAFVLALLGPALRRLRLGGRWTMTVGAIGFFALITRGEPSVLRAAVMAGLSVSASTVGRKVSSVRLLALAVAALVLVDPFLADSVGFRLSVGASLGIVLLAPPLRRSLRGPAWLAEALAVTLAAQAGVAPVIVTSFGGLPVVAVPANLLAVPVAGLVMVWGLGAGLVAGTLGGRWATLLHAPTRAMIAWVSWVAARAARTPLGTIGPVGAGVMVGGLVLVVLSVRAGRRWWARFGYLALAVALLAPSVTARLAKPPLRVEAAAGVVVWRSGDATVVELGAGPADRILEALRSAGVRRIDLLIVANGGASAASGVAAVRHRWAIGGVLHPDGSTLPGSSPEVGTGLAVGRLYITVVAVRPKLRVRVVLAAARPDASRRPVGSAGAPRARSPPPRRHVPGSGHRHREPDAGLLLRPRALLRVRRLPGARRAPDRRRC